MSKTLFAQNASRGRRARALLLITTLGLAVMVEPALALAGFSSAGFCPCAHDAVEISGEESCPSGLCHEMSYEVGAEEEKPPPAKTCIKEFCPHCSSDQPRMLSCLRGLVERPPASQELLLYDTVERDAHGIDLPEVPIEIFHIPIV